MAGLIIKTEAGSVTDGVVKLEVRSADALLVLHCCDKDRLLGKTRKTTTFMGEARLSLQQASSK